MRRIRDNSWDDKKLGHDLDVQTQLSGGFLHGFDGGMVGGELLLIAGNHPARHLLSRELHVSRH